MICYNDIVRVSKLRRIFVWFFNYCTVYCLLFASNEILFVAVVVLSATATTYNTTLYTSSPILMYMANGCVCLLGSESFFLMDAKEPTIPKRCGGYRGGGIFRTNRGCGWESTHDVSCIEVTHLTGRVWSLTMIGRVIG